MRVRILHRTTYKYAEPASFGPHIIRLRPADHSRARVLAYNLSIDPEPPSHWQQDAWGHRILRARFEGLEPSKELSFAVETTVEVRPVNPFDFSVDGKFEQLPPEYPGRLARELSPFRTPIEMGPLTTEMADANPPKGYVVDYLVGLNQAVSQRVGYIIRNEPGIRTPEETLSIGTGSCRDSAMLLVAILRHHGFAARFVSGYLVQLTDEGNIPDEAKGVAADVVDLHAWAEVYLPGAGWIGLDGTSGLLTGEGHIPLVGAADPALAGPIEGTASRAADEMDVVMRVERVGHEPRPRVPYTDPQWEALREAGRRVDASLKKSGLHLTMGGEPTWASRTHPKEPEWNTEALGASKWAQGVRLSSELQKRLGEDGILLHRFGKHYPGESLPRWAMHLLWRKDGEPLWRSREALDLAERPDEGRPERSPPDEGAERFRRALAARLGLGATNWMPAYEDPWPFVVDEEHLPPDVDPMKFALKDPEGRRRLARALGRGLDEVVGHVLPVGRKADSWATSQWRFRREHLFLVPGDSPIGLRLPLDRIGGTPTPTWTQDPSELPGQPARRLPNPKPGEAPRPQVLDGETESVRTALCLERRAGALRVFLPPVPTGEDFVSLLSAVEGAAVDAGVAVALEGYPPPKDPRFGGLLVTPDPGVLEVNLPVTDDFDRYVELMETVADAANHASLTPEKYQVDGRVTGSGGGHHLTLGGPSALESPFLRDPSLLAGLLRFVQNHPSLSYLFTGLFVGPTSQAPRIDEARHESLYELEIALAQLERADETAPPWLVDRLLRHLLVDVEGNTHRTEISIDKLYDPGLPSGRQGIVEFRAFEMPPHERMAAAQMLLVRAVVARLAAKPYRNPLVRWGGRLHDEFMLPHFLWADLQDVLRELEPLELGLSPEHYRPFLEFRCPLAGRATLAQGPEIELRSALEPWFVLGEQGAGSGTVRFVDAAVERLEVKVRGLVEGRHMVTANGWRLPLRGTGEASEMVAGVRFKAWQPPNGLHPTLPIHHPVRVDVVDTWADRSLGAVTYHVWHPEGRAFDQPPLTAFEAAARRAQRFTTEGHAPAPAEPRQPLPHPEQPVTLDLRRCF